jgi:hypothetical protein
MRTSHWLCIGLVLLMAGGLLLPAAGPASIAELRRAFEHPPDDARIMVRWWWFGPSVSKPELRRELRAMKDGGIGGVEVQTVYPLELDDPAIPFHNFPYLSDEFIDALRFANDEARELGLRLDLTLCSGWPYGGPHIPLEQAAGRLRVVRGSAAPTLAPGETLLASFPDQGLYFVASHTRMMVKRAALGAEGLVLDHYGRAAIENHLHTVGDRLMQAFPTHPPTAVFSDSLEVEHSDWTTNLLDEFRRRRGYDLKPYLPALAVDIGEKTMAVRHDWGQTLTELAQDNYLTPLREWAHRHGTLFRSQTYGTPPVVLSSNALVDLPEGEGWQWRHFTATRWATSAGHLYGNPVVSSETWTWLHSPVFRATPLDMKAEADLHFLQGVNQLVGHGWPYSPASAGEPGWRFYAAAVFSDHNPWWMVMPDIAAYLQRVSFLLRQGRPANDIAVYLPTDDAYAAFTPGNDSVNEAMDDLLAPNRATAIRGAGHNAIGFDPEALHRHTLLPAILDAGYNFDFIDDAAIAHAGIPHKIVILPNVQRIPLATLQKLAEYARKGGALIATRRAPSLAPGLMEDADTTKIGELSHKLFDGHLIADETNLANVLHQIVAADVSTASEIGFIHRKLDYADIYFLANTSNRPVHAAATFRITGLDSAWWNSYDGTAAKAGGATLDLDLAPYESRVVVFSKDRIADRPQPATPPPAGIDLTAPLHAQHSWTEDESQKYFSGQKTFEASFSVPQSMLASGHRLFLNFGEGTPVTTPERRSGSGMRAMLESPVREAAVVYLNGRRAGSVWHAPYEVEAGPLLHLGVNTVRIVVANLAINELAKGPLPDYKALNVKYGERFQPQDMNNLQPLPSGLLGPVRLVAR